jgi:hypothetical protein
VASQYQKSLFDDLTHPDSHGKPLAGWQNQTEIFRGTGAQMTPGALPLDLAGTFIEKLYFLVRTTRVIRVYRAYETAGLTAPFGKDHPSFLRGLVASRHPGKPDGLWWTPARPSLAIENMGLSSMQREGPRRGAAVNLEWNRMDYWIEAELPAGGLVYVGRAAPQQEKAAYGGGKLGGCDFQFRLTQPPDVAFTSMKRYTAV